MIYFAQVEPDGPIKIGYSKQSPRGRVGVLKMPWPVKVLGIIPGEPCHEFALHLALDAHRMNGEWFAPHIEVLGLIRSTLDPEFDWSCSDIAIRESRQKNPGLRGAMQRAIDVAGSEERLGELIGRTQSAISKAKHRGRASAEMAIAIERAVNGAVTRAELRPDLWPVS